MKLFITFMFYFLTAKIFASSYDAHLTKCQCVPRELCNFKFSPLIEPRNVQYDCSGRNVCCKSEHIISITDSNYDSDFKDLSKISTKKPQNGKLKCGEKAKIRAYRRLVLPASLAALGEFPWQAAILRNHSRGFIFVSSGVLIKNNVIVTTAHNVEDIKAQDILIRLGENNVQADPKKLFFHYNAKISRILIKENFNRDTLENDLAILCLEKKLRFNEIINPICLPDSTTIADIQNCVVSGWGKSSYKGNYSSILRKANLKLVPFKICQNLLRKRISDPTYVLDPSFMCAGGEAGKDACTGDAGGPLSCPDKNGQQILTGIVSWGIGCGEKNVPGIYTDIRYSSNLEWIKDVIHVCDNNKTDKEPNKQNISKNNTDNNSGKKESNYSLNKDSESNPFYFSSM